MMNKVFFGTLFVVLFRLYTSLSRNYTAKINVDDKILHKSLLAEYFVHSLVMCSAMCGLGCTYFGVNLQRKKCRVYGGCHSTNSTVAEVGWRYYNPDSEVLENFRPKDCKSLLAVGFTASCIYTIYPWYNNPVEVFCDMDTKDGGWTAIQRRVNGSIDFDRFWNEYKEGFGSAYSSYWIGNDVIHQLTMNRPSLYVSITLTNGTTLYQQYKEFSVSSETDNYRLYLAGPTEGTLGDSMLDTGYPNYDDLSGMYFSTHDRDNDRWIYNCADFYNRKGGWWFNGCHRAFLNGRWSLEYWVWPWYPTLTDGREIKETVMMIKTL